MRLRKARFLFVYGLAILGVWFARTNDSTLRWGALIIVVGETLRIWANGHIAKRKSHYLVTSGPYAWLQHPLYTGTLLIGVGFCVMVGHWWFAVIAVVLFGMIYRAKVDEETSLLTAAFGADYAAYRNAVPRFWPRHWRPYAARSREPFLWANVAASGEFKTMLWLLVAFFIVYLHGEWFVEHESLRGKHLVAIACAAMFIGVDVIAEIVSRWRAVRS